MNLLGNLAARLRSVFRRGREDDETREELRFHLEMETQKNLRAGMDPREARRRAHARLGGVEAVREAVRDARGMRPLEDLLRDLGYALRGTRRNPGFTLAAVVSLAIPIGFNTTIFTIVDSLLFRPLPVVRPAELVDVYTSYPGGNRYSTSSYEDYVYLRAENDVFTDMAAHVPISAAVRADDAASVVMGEAVTGNYFRFLGVQPVLGRMLAPEDDRPGAPRVAVISRGLWDRAFGRDPDVVGRSVRIRSQPYLVVGVAPPGFAGMLPLLGPDLWTPMTWIEDVSTMTFSAAGSETRPERGQRQRLVYVKGRLRDGVMPAQADASLDVTMAGLAAADPDSGEHRRVSLTLTENARLPAGMAGPAYVVGAVGLMLVGVVLLVACANVMGMLLARAAARRREIGVRLAVGASRGRLVRQLLTESLVVSGLGAGAGLALAWGLLRTVAAAALPIGPFQITFEFLLDARAFLFTAALAAGAGVAAGLVPALGATRPNVVRDLNGAVAVARAGGRRWVLRDALVAVQLAVTVPLLVLAGLLARSAIGASDGVSPGFDPDRIAVVGVDLSSISDEGQPADRFLRTALERVASMPGVQAASQTSDVPSTLRYSPRMSSFQVCTGRPIAAFRWARPWCRQATSTRWPSRSCRGGPSSPPTRASRRESPSSARPWPCASGRRGRRSGGVSGWGSGTDRSTRSSACRPTTRSDPAPRSPLPICTSPHPSTCVRSSRCSLGPTATRRRCPPSSAASCAGWSRTSSSISRRTRSGRRPRPRCCRTGSRQPWRALRALLRWYWAPSASTVSSPISSCGGRGSSRFGRRWARDRGLCSASCWRPGRGWRLLALASAPCWPSS